MSLNTTKHKFGPSKATISPKKNYIELKKDFDAIYPGDTNNDTLPSQSNGASTAHSTHSKTSNNDHNTILGFRPDPKLFQFSSKTEYPRPGLLNLQSIGATNDNQERSTTQTANFNHDEEQQPQKSDRVVEEFNYCSNT